MCTQYTNTSNILKIIQQQQACGTELYENAHTQAFAIELSRTRDHEPSLLRTFSRLQTCVCKRARQSRQQSVVIQSALCEIVILIVKI